jgi:hypothetical protein
MTTTIFTLIACVGFSMFIIGLIPIFKGNVKKKNWYLWTTGQVLVLPLASQNTFTENTLVFWICFVAVLGAIIVGIYNLGESN